MVGIVSRAVLRAHSGSSRRQWERWAVLYTPVKAAVHWVRVNAFSAESSPNLAWAAMGLRADSARPQRVSGSARTDSRRAESARNPIAAHVKFGDDCVNAQPGLSQWTAALSPLHTARDGAYNSPLPSVAAIAPWNPIVVRVRQLNVFFFAYCMTLMNVFLVNRGENWYR